MTNIDHKITDRIRKLLALTKSANEHEAAAAAARAAQLMEEHQITEAVLRITDDTKTAESIIEGAVDKDRGGGKRVAWKLAIAGGAAVALGLSKVWTRGGTMMALGRDSAIKSWSYLCAYLFNEVNRLADVGWETSGRWNGGSARAWKNAFRYGAARTIHARLQEQAKTQSAGRKAAVKAAAQLASGTTEATGATMALAVIHKDQAEVSAAYEARSAKFAKASPIGQTSSTHGYMAGRVAGAHVKLTGGGPGLPAAPKAQIKGGKS